MKSVDIVKTELAKSGIVLAEELVHGIVDCLVKKILPELALNADESAIKAVAGVACLALPALMPAIEKLEDLNHDGKVGVV